MIKLCLVTKSLDNVLSGQILSKFELTTVQMNKLFYNV